MCQLAHKPTSLIRGSNKIQKHPPRLDRGSKSSKCTNAEACGSDVWTHALAEATFSSAQGLRKCVRKRFVTSVGTKKEKKNCIQMGTDAACPPAMGSNSQCRSMLDGYVIWAVNAAAAQHQQHDLWIDCRCAKFYTMAHAGAPFWPPLGLRVDWEKSIWGILGLKICGSNSGRHSAKQ